MLRYWHVSLMGQIEPMVIVGPFVTYSTFRISASLSHGSPSHPICPPIRTPRPLKPANPHPPPSATQPEPLPNEVVHRNSSTPLIQHTWWGSLVDLLVPPIQPPHPPPPRSSPDVHLVYCTTSIPTTSSSPAPSELQNLHATCELCWDFLEEDRMMLYNRDKYFPQLRTNVINHVGKPRETSLAAPTHTKANTCTQRDQRGCQSPRRLFARIKTHSDR